MTIYVKTTGVCERLQVKTGVENVLFEATTELSSKIYNIGLYPSLVFHNLLPYPVKCMLEVSIHNVYTVRKCNKRIVPFYSGQLESRGRGVGRSFRKGCGGWSYEV